MNIILLTIIRQKHINKGYSLSCQCVAIVLTCVFNSWDKLIGPLKVKLMILVLKFLHDGCKLIKWTWLWNYCKHNSWQLKIMWLLKRHCPNYMPFIYLPSFEASQVTEDGNKVIRAHTHGTESHTTMKTPMNDKSVN